MTSSPPRIVSLLPSATEIVCGIGLGDALVGISHECDYPPEVLGLPILTSSKASLSGTSGDIDRDIRSLLKNALAVYDVDTSLLAALDPDVIVTQDLCDVCAVSLSDVEKAVHELVRDDVRIVNLHPQKLGDIWSDVRTVGEGLGRPEGAEALLRDLDARVARVRERVARIEARPNVLTIEWIDPVMLGGTWMPELVELAGGRALVTTPGQHAPTLSIEELAALDPAPDVVLIKPCGFSMKRSLEELDTLREILTACPWPAVREGRLWLADGHAYFNRPGPRIVDSLEILAACVHPGELGDLARKHVKGFQPLALPVA